MRWFTVTGRLAAALLFLGGCSQDASRSGPADPAGAEGPCDCCAGSAATDQTASTAHRSGSPQGVAFAVAWASDPDPAQAAKIAAVKAIDDLGCPAKGIIFYQYFAKTVLDADGNEQEAPDTERERAVLPALRSVAGGVPVIGCRAVPLASGGTMPSDAVVVLAIGGQKVSCKVAKAELGDDRLAVGQAVAEQLADVEDLKLVVALSEMSLSFETKEGVSVEDFIRGLLEAAGKGVTLFGGNCLPNAYPDDLGGIQFIDDEIVEGSVVAMGIGGPIAVFANHTNEFVPSDETLTVTKAEDKWVHELDGRPAADVYRELRGMEADEEFTSDWQHPIGVIVAPEKVYLRMVLEENKESKALRFVAAVPQGTKVKVLKGGDDAEAVLAAARRGMTELLDKAGSSRPLLALLSNCCARGFRLREFGAAEQCEIRNAVMPVIEQRGAFPVFGFYAWGELGPIAGTFDGLDCMYQQHTFVAVVLAEGAGD
jgi:hypothetical protein